MGGYEIAELQVRFVRPVPVGSALTIAARSIDASDPQHHLRLLATVEGVLVAIAEARLEPLSEPTE